MNSSSVMAIRHLIITNDVLGSSLMPVKLYPCAKQTDTPVSRKMMLATVLTGVLALLSACYKPEIITPIPQAGTPLTEFKQDLRSSAQLDQLLPNERLVIPVDVKNTGQQTWPSTGVLSPHKFVNLAHSWLDADGKLMHPGRTALPGNHAPGDVVTLMVPLHAPAEPGLYTLRFTMIQEGVSFFDRRGARPLDFKISVSAKGDL